VINEIETTLREAANRKNITYSIKYNGFHAEGCTMDKESEMMKLLARVHNEITKNPPTYFSLSLSLSILYFEIPYIQIFI
jgi:hypothetical protein